MPSVYDLSITHKIIITDKSLFSVLNNKKQLLKCL